LLRAPFILRRIFFNVWLAKCFPVKCFPCKIFVSGGERGCGGGGEI
jgi:hypothetical protein